MLAYMIHIYQEQQENLADLSDIMKVFSDIISFLIWLLTSRPGIVLLANNDILKGASLW